MPSDRPAFMTSSNYPPIVSCLAMLVAMLSTVSCTWTSRQESSLVVPSSWQQGSGSSLASLDIGRLAQWWTRFQDPVLDELIKEALESSLDVRITQARLEESRARQLVSRSLFFPTVEGDLSGAGSRSENRRTGILTTDSFSAGMTMNWEIDINGRLRQNHLASSADLAQANENYYGAQVILAATIAQAYVDLRTAEAQLSVYERNLEARSDTVQITRWRERAGEGTRLESQQAASTLEQARATIPNITLAITQTTNLLAVLSGKTSGSLDSMLARSRGIPRPPSVLNVGIPADTLRQRPDVRAAQRGVEAAAARTKAAERDQLPNLGLHGDLSTTATKAANFLSPETVAASVVGSLSAPIFNAGRIRQTILVQSAQEKQALITYESTVLTALSEVEDTLAAVRSNRERLQTLDRAVVSAKEAATLAAQNYEAGQVDLLQVLESQRTLLSLEEQKTLTLGSHANAHIQLYRALGGGWSTGN